MFTQRCSRRGQRWRSSLTAEHQAIGRQQPETSAHLERLQSAIICYSNWSQKRLWNCYH